MNQHSPIVAPSVSIEGRILSKALKPIAWVVQRRSSHPILATVRMTLSDGGLRIASTDLDIDIGVTLDVISGGGAFDVCVSCDVLVGIANAAGPSVMAFRKIEKASGRDDKGSETSQTVLAVSVEDGAVEYEIENVLGPDGFPSLPGERKAELERFTNGMLADALRRCEAFISKEETRYYLNGVYWANLAGGREFVATDGHRMARYRYSAEAGDGVGRIIPHKTVALLTRFFRGSDIIVYDVGNGATKIDFLADGFAIRSKLIEGTFPDYTRVIPTITPEHYSIAFSKAGLSYALQLASAMPSSQRIWGRAIHVHQLDGMLCLKLKSSDMGSAIARTNFPWPDGAPDFGLNAQYLRDNLASCDGDVRFVLKGAGDPVLILDADETMTRIQMPMRV